MEIRLTSASLASVMLGLSACSGTPEPTPAQTPTPTPVPVAAASPGGMEDLILPRVGPDGEERPHTPPGVIVDVSQGGLLLQDGRQLLDLNVATAGQVADLLRGLRREGLAVGRLSLRQKGSGNETVEVIAEPILIRVEKGTEWRLVQDLMTGCSQPDIAFWQVQLTMRQPPQ